MPFLDLQDLEERQLGPGFRGQFVHSDHMTFAYWNIDANAALPEHSHPHEQVASVLSGEFELNVDVESGQALVLRKVPLGGKSSFRPNSPS